ncbi:MAG: hypothetical protein NNA23_06355 [Nitrospira sp.]|nr:hypothetical protein [Nitrospira sp.]MCP9463324.1 hypothetical protein [Nitrospira sp.]
MQSIENNLTVIDAGGPFREPREEVLSYDYSIQRSTWPTPHGVRVKVSIPDELAVFRERLLGSVSCSPGRQLMINNILSKKIADWKIKIAEQEGLLAERRDVMLAPFVGPWSHLLPKLEEWFQKEQVVVREEIRKRVGV